MYKINDIALSEFGIIPGQTKGSNLALAGWLDMPKRLGKTYHVWHDRQGIEPYVDWEDIYFGGRDLVFSGFINYQSIEDLDVLLNNFYSFLKGDQKLLKLETPFGVYSVFVKKEIKTETTQRKVCAVEITFREPQAVTPFTYFSSAYFTGDYFQQTVLPVIYDYPANYAVFGIDGIPFSVLGAFQKKPLKQLHRATTHREYKLNSYDKETFDITPSGALKTKLELIFSALDIPQLKNKVQTLQALLAKPNVRTLQVDGRIIQGFCVDGFKVKNIQQATGACTCEVQLELIQITERYFKPGFFAEGFFQ